MFQMIALNGFSDERCVESVELTKSCRPTGENEAKLGEAAQAVRDDSHSKSEMDVIYAVDESPAASLCLLLGFQVNMCTRL